MHHLLLVHWIWIPISAIIGALIAAVIIAVMQVSRVMEMGCLPKNEKPERKPMTIVPSTRFEEINKPFSETEIAN